MVKPYAQHASSRISPDPVRLIDEHFRIFNDFGERAQRALDREDLEDCAGYVQLAAQYAWFHPTGLLASPELEALLGKISLRLPDPERVRSRRDGMQRVLHVVTEVYNVGGHTKLVWRWIQADTRRTHSLVLTRQMESSVPFPLHAAVTGSGGQIHYLDRSPGGILARAWALRKLAAEVDHVIIHAHPWDVIPLIAFLEMKDRPVITHMNKDDHVFFLGTKNADLYAQMREAGSRLCQERRGIPASHCRMLPLPIDRISSGPSRVEAKRLLGIPEDTVVLFSVASAYKYATQSQHFANVLLPVVQSQANVLLLVIGPSDQGPWAEARVRSGGRVKALGKLSKVDLYYRAADIYLDSFPFASLTSCLEAGSCGAPVVSFWYHSPDAETLCAEEPALTEVVVRGHTVDEYREQILGLVRDRELRERLGRITRERIEACHTEEGWKTHLEEIYAAASSSSRSDHAPEVRRQITELDLELTRTYTASGLCCDVRRVISDHVGMFPFKTRVGLWAKEFSFGARSLPTCLLSDGQKTRLRLLCSQLGAD